MNTDETTLAKIVESYKVFIDSCAGYNFFTRSVQGQKEKIEECVAFITLIKSCKKKAIESELEQNANNFFHMQCMINAMKSSLEMWVKVKESRFEDAWRLLIDAQEYTEVALKITDYEGVRKFESSLKSIESSIFPNWAIYNSSGHTETIGKCSICHSNFALCEHVENQVYFGQLCQRIGRKIIKADHIALVKKPKDKRCIITQLTNDDGKTIDCFTRSECEDQTLSLNAADNSMKIKSIIMSTRPLDFN
ncbi:MAG: hypothetical protein ACJAZP_003804 [Psychromonas sp.]|jgi:hypothetical protein|uniref:hypothetical protein n=1 Tax=Psychromonas sp. TaxID=1884585 RepID=UPI0039E66D55